MSGMPTYLVKKSNIGTVGRQGFGRIFKNPFFEQSLYCIICLLAVCIQC